MYTLGRLTATISSSMKCSFQFLLALWADRLASVYNWYHCYFADLIQIRCRASFYSVVCEEKIYVEAVSAGRGSLSSICLCGWQAGIPCCKGEKGTPWKLHHNFVKLCCEKERLWVDFQRFKSRWIF